MSSDRPLLLERHRLATRSAGQQVAPPLDQGVHLLLHHLHVYRSAIVVRGQQWVWVSGKHGVHCQLLPLEHLVWPKITVLLRLVLVETSARCACVTTDVTRMGNTLEMCLNVPLQVPSRLRVAGHLAADDTAPDVAHLLHHPLDLLLQVEGRHLDRLSLCPQGASSEGKTQVPACFLLRFVQVFCCAATQAAAGRE